MGMATRRVVTAGVATLIACLSPAMAQDFRTLGTFDGWLVVEEPGEACVMVNPADYEAASTRVHLRFEPGQDTELVASTIIPARVPDPDAVDWGRLTPTEGRYGFSNGADSGEIRATPAEIDIGYEYVDAGRVRLDAYFNADEAMVDRLARASYFHVEFGENGGYFPLGQPARALAEVRRCLARVDR